jgi:acyl-CoA synthetase (NDP forming)
MAQVALLGLIAAGGAMQVAGNIMHAQRSADMFNAGQMDKQAQLAHDQGALDLQKQEFSDKQQLGSIRSAYGASGLSMDGSAQDVLEMNTAIAKLNEETIKHKTIVQTQMYQDQANQYRGAAGADFWSGIFGAGAAVGNTGAALVRTA